jgi:hypothetical protein
MMLSRCNRQGFVVLTLVALLAGTALFPISPALKTASAVTSGYDLDFVMPSGSHTYVYYSQDFTTLEKTTINNYFNVYLPAYNNQFFEIEYVATINVVRSNGGGWATGSILYSNNNRISYNGTVAVYDTGLFVFLHELTHVFQFWVPWNFQTGGSGNTFIEGAANAFANIALFNVLGWNNSEYTGAINRNNELVSPSSSGVAAFLFSAWEYNDYTMALRWEKLWYSDNQFFRKLNAFIANAYPNRLYLRDSLVSSFFEKRPNCEFEGYSLDDWLNGYSFYNLVSDLPQNKSYIYFSGSNSLMGNGSSGVSFGGQVFAQAGGVIRQVNITSYDVAIVDGFTGQLLYSKNNQVPQWGNIDYLSVSVQKCPLVIVSVTARLSEGGVTSATAYYQDNEMGDGTRAIFFLNPQGYAEGNGASNVGAVVNGTVFWKNGDNVKANVTWSKGTYTYVINNIMAHPRIPLTQIAIRLNESKTFLSPVFQELSSTSAHFNVTVSPLVSSGTIRLYHSTDKNSWSQVAETTPIRGEANFSIAQSAGGVHYYMASWSGDGFISPSNSSAARINVNTAIPELPTLTVLLSVMATTAGLLVYVRKRRAD